MQLPAHKHCPHRTSVLVLEPEVTAPASQGTSGEARGGGEGARLMRGGERRRGEQKE